MQVVCALLWPPYVGNLNSAGRLRQRCTSCCSVWTELLEFCQGRLLWSRPAGFVSDCFPDITPEVLRIREDACTQARGSSCNPHRFFNNWETELEFDICEGLQGEIFQVYVLLCPVVVWCPSQKYKTLLSPEILLMNIWELFLVGSLFPLRFLFFFFLKKRQVTQKTK